jgi:hypothetical protein
VVCHDQKSSDGARNGCEGLADRPVEEVRSPRAAGRTRIQQHAAAEGHQPPLIERGVFLWFLAEDKIHLLEWRSLAVDERY